MYESTNKQIQIHKCRRRIGKVNIYRQSKYNKEMETHKYAYTNMNVEIGKYKYTNAVGESGPPVNIGASHL